MKNIIITSLIFGVIQINVHATIGARPGTSALHGSGDLVQDMTRTVEWTRDANLVQTLCSTGDPLWTSFDPLAVENGTGRDAAQICAQEGRMNWYEAQAWIQHLNHQAYLGYDNWRLPQVSYGDQSCSDLVEIDNQPVAIGYDCRNGEPGRLNAMLGSNIDRFTNLDERLYWSGSELATNQGLVGVFNVQTSWQDAEGKTSDLLHVWPVHSL